MTEPLRARRFPRPRTLLTIAGLLLVVGACAAGVFALRNGGAQPTRAFSLIYPRYDTLIATVNATGQIEPAQVANLNFGGVGRVGEVLVKVGDVVAAGAALARLDTRELSIRVAQAEVLFDADTDDGKDGPYGKADREGERARAQSLVLLDARDCVQVVHGFSLSGRDDWKLSKLASALQTVG